MLARIGIALGIARRRAKFPRARCLPDRLAAVSAHGMTTAADLRDLFLATLIRERGGTRREWRLVLGDIRVYPVATHPHCNWSATPGGDPAENAAVERIADDLRQRHPIVTR